MSAGLGKGVGVPVKLLHESEGHVVTVELKTGETYRGQLVESEDNWNCQMTDVTHTGRDGKESKMEHVYIRGSQVRMMVIPDMLKHAPMFKRLDPKFDPKGGAGRGKK